MRTLLLAVLTSVLTTSQVWAEVGRGRFDDLAKGSDIIVVAKIQSVRKPIFGKHYAKAKVIEVWKGKQTETVEFLASPTWTCDISEAKEGETVLLFLVKSDKSRSYVIARSGRGRMPLRDVNDKTYATFWPEVILPADTSTVDGPEPRWKFIRSVEVTTLRDLVKKALEKKE